MTRTTAGWVVLAVAISGGGASGQGAARPGTEARRTAPPIVAAGASFSEPMGWTRVQTPEKSKTIGRFIDPGSNSAEPRRMILIDFGRPTERDARTSAEGLAKQWGGTVKDQVTLDGAPGYLVAAENRGPGLKPVAGIVVHREGRAYLLMAGAVPGQSVANELEDVRRGWKWVKGR